MKNKIIPQAKLIRLCRSLRRSGKKIVFTNGAFDILHAGHVMYLQKAREAGDFLIVGVNSDKSVKTYKDPSRPVNPEGDRMKVLAALECVNAVVLFRDPTPLNLIVKARPHVLVKGSDWKISEIAGAKEVMSWGGKVRRIPLLKKRSTSSVIRKIEKSARKRRKKKTSRWY